MFHNSYPIQNLQGIIHTRKQSRTDSCQLIIQVPEDVATVFDRNISKLYCAVSWVKVQFVLLIQWSQEALYEAPEMRDPPDEYC